MCNGPTVLLTAQIRLYFGALLDCVDERVRPRVRFAIVLLGVHKALNNTEFLDPLVLAIGPGGTGGTGGLSPAQPRSLPGEVHKNTKNPISRRSRDTGALRFNFVLKKFTHRLFAKRTFFSLHFGDIEF